MWISGEEVLKGVLRSVQCYTKGNCEHLLEMLANGILMPNGHQWLPNSFEMGSIY